MTVMVDGHSLQTFATAIFAAAGLPPRDAATEAKVLVWANLRGVDSHGVLRIPSYVASIERGGMNPTPNIEVVKDTPAMSLIDADWAFGPVVTTIAMERAISKAKAVGIGWILIRNTTHQGAMGYYTLMAAEAGMAGIAAVCNPPNMAPYGASVPGVHNSPLSIGVPGGKHRPLILDMATSVAAGGKVALAIDKGIEIPVGWALDKEGRPTCDPSAVGALLPAGSYKGSGLALMLECLSSLMVGNPLIARRLADEPIHPGTQNSFVAAIDIATFTGLKGYQEDVDQTVDRIKDLPKAEGFDEILMPGEPEARTYDQRSTEGIPLPDGTAHNLIAVANQLQIPVPDWLQS